MAHILIKGGTIVTMDRGTPDLPTGDILVEDGRILELGPALGAPPGAELIDASGMIVIPGLVNGHVHTWQSALRGLAADWTVAHYMQAMHRGLATLYRPEDIYIANLAGALNQINSGTTTLVDWCHNNPTPEHTDAAIDGLVESGIRALFLHGSPKPAAKPGQKPFSEVPMPRSEVARLRSGRLASDGGLITFGLAILGPYYSTYEVSQHDVKLGTEFDLITSMHAGGGTPLVADGFDRLLAAGLVGSKFNIVHGNDTAPETVRALIDRGATFTVTAEIELQMGYGDPVTGLVRQFGAPLGIGSDVEPAVRGDMFTAMRVTLQHERHRATVEQLAQTGSRPADIPVTSRDALEWATIQGAKLAGLDSRIGSLTPGKCADIVLVDATDISMCPVRDPVGSIVMQGGVAAVDTVMIAGRVVKKGGKLLYPALAARMAELRRSGDRILATFNAGNVAAYRGPAEAKTGIILGLFLS
jgi:cytosine/adenosine deaminase-related metal-dependent hydrolase